MPIALSVLPCELVFVELRRHQLNSLFSIFPNMVTVIEYTVMFHRPSYSHLNLIDLFWNIALIEIDRIDKILHDFLDSNYMTNNEIFHVKTQL